MAQSETSDKNKLDCENLSTEQINFEVKNSLFKGIRHIILLNASSKKDLLNGLKGNVRIEIIGNAGVNFASNIDGPKIVVNGDIGDNSAYGVNNGKFTVYGSCANCFGHNIKSGEFYILENCRQGSFFNLSGAAKVVLGGLPAGGFVKGLNGGIIVVLNLKGGKAFIDETWLNEFNDGIVYVRGMITNLNSNISLEEASEIDEDVYLPLISEFARLFNMSLSEIKSAKFYKLIKG